MQGTWVRALVQEDPTCHGATKPMSHNYWGCTLEPASHNYWIRTPQLLKPACLEPVLHNKRSQHNKKPMHCNEEYPLLSTRESPRMATKNQHSQKKKKNYPKIQELKIINIYYLTVSVGQEFVHSLARCLWLKVFYEVTVKLSARVATSSEGSTEEGSTSELTHVVVGKIQFLTSYWSDGSSHHWMSTSVPSWASPTGQLTRWQLASLRVSKQRDRERTLPRQKLASFYNPV